MTGDRAFKEADNTSVLGGPVDQEEARTSQASSSASGGLDGVFPAEPRSVTEIRRRCSRFAAGAGAPASLCEAIAIAVTEAATNAVLHGYPPDRPGMIHVRAAVTPQRFLTIAIEDSGVGLGNAQSSGGLGQGLLLMDQLADTLGVTRRRGGGTAVRMRFQLP